MNITHKVSIDLAFVPNSANLPIRVMQGDQNSRSIAFTLTSQGEPWTAPEGIWVCVGYQKPDETRGIYDTLPDGSVAWSVAGNVLTVAIAPQVSTAAGDVKLAVSLISKEKVISTFPVLIHVEALPGFGGVSKDYENLLGLLPAVDDGDDGKILQVVAGVWKAMNFSGIATEETVMLAKGTAIAANTDLDSMITYGNYKCTSATTVKTLLNCPVTGAFFMRIGSPAPGVTGYYYQEIFTLGGTRYYRYTGKSGETWTAWRQTFDTTGVIPARYGGMGADASSDLGEAEHLACCQRFVDKMNENAAMIGMTNSTFTTPSGLCTKPVNASKTGNDIAYNNYITAYDLLRLLVAARHTPTVYAAMNAEKCNFLRNGAAYLALNIIVGNAVWTDWAEQNGYTILAAKGGSLQGIYGEIGMCGINNGCYLIQDGNGDIFAVAVVGLQNPIKWFNVTYAKNDKVKVDGVTYISLADNNKGNAVSDPAYWAVTESEGDVLRTIIHDLIGMAGGGSETDAIRAANGRRYPVGMAVAKLTQNGTFDEDIAALDSGVYYNQNTVRVAASVSKILAAITAVPYLGNHNCSVTYDDMVGGSGLDYLVRGDVYCTADALNVMLAVSENTMATMLARICGKKM